MTLRQRLRLLLAAFSGPDGALGRWRKLPPRPPLPPAPAPPEPGSTVLQPHQEQALREAAQKISEADARLAFLRDRLQVLGLPEPRPAPQPAPTSGGRQEGAPPK